MNLVIDRVYLDRMGMRWKVSNLNNGQREDIGPVTATCLDDWPRVRIFRRDGTYSVDGVSDWDLVSEAPK